MSIQIVEWSAQQVVHNRYDLGTVYRNAFATYPYYTSAQVALNFIDQTLPAHVQRPGFRCIVALNTDIIRCLVSPTATQAHPVNGGAIPSRRR